MKINFLTLDSFESFNSRGIKVFEINHQVSIFTRADKWETDTFWVSGDPFKTNGIKVRTKIPLTPKTPTSKQAKVHLCGASIPLAVLWSSYNEALLHRPDRKCAVKSQRAASSWKLDDRTHENRTIDETNSRYGETDNARINGNGTLHSLRMCLWIFEKPEDATIYVL